MIKAITLFAIIMLFGANGCFILPKPVISNVSSESFQYRLTTNESVANITDRISPIQAALGFNDSAKIHQIAVDIVQYIEDGKINSNETLVWEIKSFPSIGVLRLLHIYAQVNQDGARRILSITGRYVNITQKIPDVYTYKKECHRVESLKNTKPVQSPNNKHAAVPHGHQVQQSVHGGQLKQLIQNSMKKVQNKLSQKSHDNHLCHHHGGHDHHDHHHDHHDHGHVVCKIVKVKRDLNQFEKLLVKANLMRALCDAEKILG